MSDELHNLHTNDASQQGATHTALAQAQNHLAPKAPQSEAARALMRKLPEVIEEAAQKGIRVLLTGAGYEIDGFYRQGAIRVEIDDRGFLVGIDKKEKRTPLKSFDDLVKLNFNSWKASRDRAEFMNPGKEWLEEYQRMGLVQRQVIYVPA